MITFHFFFKYIFHLRTVIDFTLCTVKRKCNILKIDSLLVKSLGTTCLDSIRHIITSLLNKDFILKAIHYLNLQSIRMGWGLEMGLINTLQLHTPLRAQMSHACWSHQLSLWLPRSWTMPEYKCHWRAVNPDTKVAVVFGLLAARRYGTDVTLWQGLQGRGEAYRTLLREGVTAFLNSYHSPQFHYNALEVVRRTNWALMGSPRGVLLTALRFSRANSGSGNVTCKFTPCKWFIRWALYFYLAASRISQILDNLA